jgi:hypothetical protein
MFPTAMTFPLGKNMFCQIKQNKNDPNDVRLYGLNQVNIYSFLNGPLNSFLNFSNLGILTFITYGSLGCLDIYSW